MKPGDVVVVVPTRNSARTLRPCLESLRRQSVPCRVVVVDNFSDDDTMAIAKELADVCVSAGPERSRQRNVGARSTRERIVGFVDSDMVLAPSVVAEVVAAIEGGAGMVTVPERSVGDGYWARVRAFERAFYDGRDDVEAPRFFRRDVFEQVGGFDEELDAGEDWDLALRARPLASLGRTSSAIIHLEGAPTYLQCCAKKGGYAAGIRAFARKHGVAALGRAARRPYLEAPWRLVWPHPLLGAGLVALKSGEAVAVAWRLARDPLETRRLGVPPAAALGRESLVAAYAGAGGESSSRSTPAGRPRTCELVVPAYNEAPRIARALDSVREARLPTGWAWTRWAVLDGASDDDTPEVARAWAEAHASPPLVVQSAVEREGKAAALGAWHARVMSELGADRDGDHVVVVLDADVAVEPGSFSALLAPFVHDAVAVVWGADVPDTRAWGTRASGFQMEAAARLARFAGTRSPRAYGRFFAYRPALLADFCWERGQVDDLQLCRHVAARGLEVHSAWDATVKAIPAHGYADFYRQTYRFFEARARGAATQGSSGEQPGRRLDRILAVALAARADPLGVLAYALARLVCAGRHAFAPVHFGDAWEPARSTKGSVERSGGEARRSRVPTAWAGPVRRALAKLMLAWRCSRELENWPEVFTKVLLGRLGWEHGMFRAGSRQGVVLHAPNTAPARWPLIEVLVDDVYRQRGWTFEDPDAARLVLDVGAHVGSFTCALAPRLPGARFVCVEPSPVAAAWLRVNLLRNGIGERATVIEAAIAETEGDAVLVGGDEASCGATTLPGAEGPGPRVRTTTLDALVAAIGAVPDIVKLDCEGAEYAAVLGSASGLWRHVGEVLLEYHPVAGHDFTELRARLEAAGMELLWQAPFSEKPGQGMASFRRIGTGSTCGRDVRTPSGRARGARAHGQRAPITAGARLRHES